MAPPDTSFPLEDMLNNSSIIFYQCSLEKHHPIIRISPNVESILGYLPQMFYQSATFWMDHIHPREKESVSTSFLDIINQKKRTYIYRFKHKSGTYVWLRDENTVSYNADGEPVFITGTAINITNKMEAQQEVKELNETLESRIEERTRNLTQANRKLKKQVQYRNKAELKLTSQQKRLKLLEIAIANLNDMVMISKASAANPLDSEIVFVNKAFEHFTGYTFSEVKGKKPTFLHGPGTSRKKLHKLESTLKKHRSVRIEFINYKKDGAPYWVDLEMAPFPAEENDMEYWVGINRDITQRKEAEIALEENEKRYRAYTELSFDAIFEIALDGTITDCNMRACYLFGYERDELLGMNIRQLTPAEYRDSIPEQMSDEVTTGSKVLKRTYQKKEGATFTAEVNTKMYQRNNEDRLIAYVRDISEQMAYEETIRHSLKEKNMLLAEVHHRVKNNLAVISGLLEMQTFNAQNEDVIRELKESQARIQSIATVHETLYQSESFSDIALDDYINDLVSYISNTFGNNNTKIHFNNRVDAITLTVKQAVPCGLLLNELITNAYKHAFKGMSEGMITIHLTKKEHTIYLQVCDDGKGLPPDFEIATSSSLGMTLINTLVKQLEGTLAIDKSPHTCFKINFTAEA